MDLTANFGVAFPLAAGIRLAGATSDVHILDVRTGRWERMEPAGEPPSPRAAHAAAAVGSMVVVQVHIVVFRRELQASERMLRYAEACTRITLSLVTASFSLNHTDLQRVFKNLKQMHAFAKKLLLAFGGVQWISRQTNRSQSFTFNCREELGLLALQQKICMS